MKMETSSRTFMFNHTYSFNGSDSGNNASAFDDWYSSFNSSSLNITDFDFGLTNSDISLILYLRAGAVFYKLLIAFTALGFITNVFQIGCICRKWKERTTFNLVVLSLSLSDLLISLTGLAQGCMSLFPEKFQDFGLRKLYIIMIIVVIPSFFSVFASVFHAIFIAIQRICAVAFPFRVKRLLSRRRCIIAILLIWSISIGMSLAFVFSIITTGAADTSKGYIIISSVVVLILIYSTLLIIIKRKQAIGSQRRAQTNRRVMMYSFALMFVFVCCVLPFGVDQLNPFHDFDAANLFNRISLVLFYCNPLFDSLLYFFITYCREKKTPVASNQIKEQNVTRSDAEKTNSTTQPLEELRNRTNLSNKIATDYI